MTNYIKDLGPSSKKGYNTIYCELCEDTREIYKYDIDKLKYGCNKCNENVFKQVVSKLDFIPSEDYEYYYGRYKAIIRRCYARGQKEYLDYGARGITVYSEWKGNSQYNLTTTAKGFKEWLIWSFSYGDIAYLTLERKDNNSSYNPSNCEYIPLELQVLNKRTTLVNLENKSSIYEGVCKNKNHYMVFYWNTLLNKSITISNKQSNTNEIECAKEYDSYLIEKGLDAVNAPLIKVAKQIKYLFTEQEKLNNSINNSWKSEGLNWDLYTQVESIEGIQSFNFKHWKKGENDYKNAEMELTDIIFFVISLCIVNSLSSDNFAYYFYKGLTLNSNNKDKDTCVKLFQDINYYSINNEIEKCILCLGFLANTLSMTSDNIYNKYIAKQVLNTFRQDHGYKEGTYVKEWKSPIDPNGLIEDNVYLELFMQEAINDEPEDIYTYLYNKLKIEYNNNL